MKYIKYISLLFIIFFITGCQDSNPTYSIDEIIESIEISYQEGDHQNHVTKSMIFPLTSPLDSNIKISWISDNPSVIDYFGTVNRPDENTSVDVTFTVDNYGLKFSQVMTFKVSGSEQIIESSYTINYYFENLEDDEYSLVNVDIIDSVVGKQIVINPEVKEGFDLNTVSSILIGIVLNHDELVLDIYYDRNIYDIDLIDESIILDTLEVKYGDTITLDDPQKEGYDFVAWRKQGETVSFDFSTIIESDLILNAIFKIQGDPYTYTGYYQGAEGLYGDALVTFLNHLLNSTYDGVDYGEARYILDDTDQDQNNLGNVILVYLGTSVSGVWDYGNTWNREHVWPQSFLGVSADNDVINKASDLHNLKPSDPATNSSRSNKYYGNITNYQTYAPRDEVKGDLARILFYMDIMYDNLSLIYANEGNTYEMGNLEVLLQWHEDDPVNQFELRRNDIIEIYQSNRNPFIDHPEFVDYIYNNDATQTSVEIPQGIFGNMIFEQNHV